MKIFHMVIFTLIAIGFLAGCTQQMNSMSTTPSLSQNSAPTSRTPSPGNFQRSTQMQSSTMMTPTN